MLQAIAPRPSPLVASLTANAQARSYASRLIHSSVVWGSFSGMRLLASSRRIAPAGTPLSFKACDLTPDRRLLSGHALDSEEAHEAVGGGLDVD
jgi:hypothetical protein